MAFQGSLKELPLPDIIQLVSVSGKTGKFTLVRDTERGSIYLKNGQIVHSEIGELIGEEAVYTLAIWTQGDFQFSPGEEPQHQTITKSNTNLLMEAARRLDEWRVLSKKVPGVDWIPELKPRENRHEQITLDPQEWLLATRIDGRRSISEIGLALDISSFEVAKILYGMITAELVELKKKTEFGGNGSADPSQLLELAGRIRSIAEHHLGESGRRSIDKYYGVAVSEIRDGDGARALRSMIEEFEKTASIVGGVAVTEQLRTEIAALVPSASRR